MTSRLAKLQTFNVPTDSPLDVASLSWIIFVFVLGLQTQTLFTSSSPPLLDNFCTHPRVDSFHNYHPCRTSPSYFTLLKWRVIFTGRRPSSTSLHLRFLGFWAFCVLPSSALGIFFSGEIVSSSNTLYLWTSRSTKQLTWSSQPCASWWASFISSELGLAMPEILTLKKIVANPDLPVLPFVLFLKDFDV